MRGGKFQNALRILVSSAESIEENFYFFSAGPKTCLWQIVDRADLASYFIPGVPSKKKGKCLVLFSSGLICAVLWTCTASVVKRIGGAFPGDVRVFGVGLSTIFSLQKQNDLPVALLHMSSS